MGDGEQIDLRLDEAKRYLLERAASVDAALASFWNVKRSEWMEFPGLIQDVFDVYAELTNGGKKLRAVLAMLGYEACRHEASPSSTIEDGLQRAAGAIEILHNASLILDDIVDRSELRRGNITVHRLYAERFISQFSSRDEAAHFGVAIALNFGDQGQALAEQLLLSAGFPGHLLLRAISQMGTTTAETITGQILDLERIALNELTEARVFRIHEFKTARYTVLLPLTLGAILADAPDEVLPSIREYAIPTGIAFQIQDDILGLVGEAKTLGKPEGLDLKEGKKTLLFVLAYKAATAADKKFLLSVHGNPEATSEDLAHVKDIVARTGARRIAEDIAAGLIARAIESIPGITGMQDSQDKLLLLAEYCLQRRS